MNVGYFLVGNDLLCLFPVAKEQDINNWCREKTYSKCLLFLIKKEWTGENWIINHETLVQRQWFHYVDVFII